MGVSQITIQPQGQVLLFDLAAPGSGTEDFHLNASLSSAVTFPLTIGSDTTLYTANDGNYTLSVKQLDGTELRGDVVRLGMDVPLVVAPQPTAAQVAADSAATALLALAPTGAKAETFPRVNNYLTAQTPLSSGRMMLVAINLPAGLTVASVSFLSSTTALSAGTNQWFALYTSARALIAQTTNDTSTAWAASTVKTLSFASPPTTTYAGLHYLGIMVAATTPPSLACASSLGPAIGLPPLLCGASDTGLTTTAPATAAEPGSGALVIPYAYVS